MLSSRTSRRRRVRPSGLLAAGVELLHSSGYQGQASWQGFSGSEFPTEHRDSRIDRCQPWRVRLRKLRVESSRKFLLTSSRISVSTKATVVPIHAE